MLAGRKGHARVVVLAVLEHEFDAVRNALGADYEINFGGALTATQVIVAKPTLPFVLIRSQGRSLAPTNASARKAIEDWQPEVILLVGIAGGIVRATEEDGSFTWGSDGPLPGDIIVSNYVHYAEFTKNIPSGTKLRYFPVDQPSSTLVQEHADPLRKPVANIPPWYATIQQSRPRSIGFARELPEVFIGEMIHVEGLAGDPQNAHQQWYLTWFDHAIGVDMESIGVARALHDARTNVHYNPTWLCVRSVSDLVFALPTGIGGVSIPNCSRDANANKQPVVEAGVAEVGGDEGAPSKDDENTRARREWTPYAVDALGCFTRRIVERLVSQPREARSGDPGTDAFNGWVSVAKVSSDTPSGQNWEDKGEVNQ